MGWTFPYGNSRQQTISELTQGWTRTADKDSGEVRGTRYLAKQFKGNHHKGVLYAVGQEYVEGQPEDPNKRFILIAMMECSHYRGEHSWGYKDMSESMHPFYYSCPKKYLEMVPVVGSRDWREGVMKYHKDRDDMRALLKKIGIGATIVLQKGCKPQELTLDSTWPLKGRDGLGIYKLKFGNIDLEATKAAQERETVGSDS